MKNKIQKEKIEKEKKNYKNKNEKNIEINETNNNNNVSGNKRSAEASITPAATDIIRNMSIDNKEFLTEQQEDSLAKFLDHKKKKICKACNSKTLNLTSIDCIEIGDITEAEVTITCRSCNQKHSIMEVNTQLMAITKEKKRQVEKETTVETKELSEEDKKIIEKYQIKRKTIECIHCKKIGTVMKNGNNQGNPKKPQLL